MHSAGTAQRHMIGGVPTVVKRGLQSLLVYTAAVKHVPMIRSAQRCDDMDTLYINDLSYFCVSHMIM